VIGTRVWFQISEMMFRNEYANQTAEYKPQKDSKKFGKELGRQNLLNGTGGAIKKYFGFFHRSLPISNNYAG